MAVERWQSLLARNPEYAAAHKPSIRFTDYPLQDAQIIVTCMDPRVIPEKFLQLNESEIAVVRNAGGRANDAMRSLYTLSAIAGYGRANLGLVAVIHHTDCGMLNFNDKQIAARVQENTRPDHKSQVPQHYGEILDIDEAVREDVAAIKNDPFLADKLIVLGYIYDVASGEVKQVV